MLGGRAIWTEGFDENYMPPWTCGCCCGGILRLDKAYPVLSRPAIASEVARSLEGYTPADDYHRFAALLSCSNCTGTTVCAGTTDLVENDRSSEPALRTVLQPGYFDPAPIMIELPDGILPNGLLHILDDAFALYWVDPGASVVKLGVFLEEFLTAARVPRTRRVKQASGRLRNVSRTLHDRLEWFGKRGGHPLAAQRFLALKFLRNEGGHTSDTTTRADVLDALTLLEDGLSILANHGHRPEAIQAAASERRGSRWAGKRPPKGWKVWIPRSRGAR